jgi:hypothetical protein
LSFCRDLERKYKCNKVLHIGDFIDCGAISMHEKNPDAKGPLQEYEDVMDMVPKWYRAFPKMCLCVGNHETRLGRMAATVNIPALFLKSYKELLKTPKWTWANDYVIDDVYYFHGTGSGGQYPAFNTMSKMLMSVVQGHIHTAAGLWWRANPQRRVFGMNVGTGVDDKHLSMAYAERMKLRSILSAGVVIDGTPLHVVMPCGPREKYHRSRFQ